ncbi:GRAM domain-containing protein 1B isoform X2 [Anoplophora glabripennis]|uniref:GRAM domain-containing protein 1B isoform X2 n=1 Tax=Anoplophora glabripennis TaxID=217634 RepID=UPI0008751DDC|nr:GRAM domain-containing protein 1B isoform X2 [Anoplophora glabripennis]
MKTNLSSTSITANERQQAINTDNKSISPCSSPRSSPRPSPRPQTKRDHSKSDILLTVNYNKDQSSFKHEGSPSSQEGSISGRLSNTSNVEVTLPQADTKSESGSNSIRDKRDSRSKKKSSWFNFYPSYKSRSEDFKRLFKEVPDDERLVVDYSCALQKEILVQGRLYVTQNYLCFYANIFGWETNLTLKWKDVASITKEKTALVIPNAVLISTKSDKYFFTSFVARDKTYLMLFRFWQNALMDQPMSAQEMWQWVHQCYGTELGLTSDDEDYIAPVTEEDKFSVKLSDSFTEECNSAVEGLINQFIMEDKIIEDDAKDGIVLGHKRNGSDSHIPTDVTDNSESDAEKPIKRNNSFPFPRENSFSLHTPPTPDSDDCAPVLESPESDVSVRCTSSHEGRQLMNEVVPIHIDQLFTLLFTSSKFYLDFHAARKTTDLTQTPWTHNPLDNSKCRVVNSTVALSQTMGPKSAQVTETHTMLPCSKAGNLYSIDVDTINGGIPYGDSFCVLAHYCLQKVSETHSMITVFAQIKYKKSVWGLVKGMIERNCWAGLEDFFAHLARALHAEGEENIPELKRKSKRKRRLHSIPRCSLEDARISVPHRKKLQGSGIFSTDVCTIIVFFVLILLLILNIILYYKLWSLEETSPYTILDLRELKNPPKSHDEWIRLLQQQEALHSIEAQKWQRILRTSIQLLRQAEESLNELQRSIHPTYRSKVMSIIQNQQDEEGKEEM